MDKDILAKNEVRHYGEAVAGGRGRHPRDRQRGGRPHRGRVRGLSRPCSTTWTRSSPTPRSCIPTSGSTTTCPSSAPSRAPTSPTSPSAARATSKRASPSPSGSSSASTPTPRFSTCRWRPTSPSSSGRPATRSRSGRARSRRSPCATSSATPSSSRSTRYGSSYPTSAAVSAARRASTSSRSLACLSRKAGGRPVKMQATREEEFSLLPCRSALTYRIKTGVRADGKILAQHLTLYWDAGAYADYAVNVTRASAYSARRALRGSQRLAGRLHDLHEQALRDGLPRIRARGVLLGPRAPHGARRAGHRNGPAGVPQEEPAQARLDSPSPASSITEHTGDPTQVPGGSGEGHQLRRAHGGGADA